MRSYWKQGTWLLVFCLLFFSAFSQEWPLKRKVIEKKQIGKVFRPVQLFTFTGNKVNARGTYQELRIDTTILMQLAMERPEAIRLTVQVSAKESITCDLIVADFGNTRITTNRTQILPDISTPVCYHGIVAGESGKNSVMLTLNKDYFAFTASFNDKIIQLSKLDEDAPSSLRMYNSEQITFPAQPLLNCGTLKKPSLQAINAMQNSHRMAAPQDKCVYVFVECFDSLYLWRNNNIQETINYVYALFNNVATGYLNELINIKISTINVWTTIDPYRGDTRENALADLAAFYQDDFWGNICVGLDFSVKSTPGKGRSGIAGDIGRVKGEAPNSCAAYTAADHPFCYNDLNYNVNVANFPTGTNVTQQQVYLVMHEMGHLLGSSHTQWCGWVISTNPTVFGALDNCVPVENGPCSVISPPPSQTQGTIMSYCVGTGQSTNFNNGFGTQPGNVIRNFVDNNNCISNCPNCPSSITIGNTPVGVSHFEVSNTIIANGIVPAGSVSTFDAGTRITLSPGFRANNGAQLKVIINGCGGIR